MLYPNPIPTSPPQGPPRPWSVHAGQIRSGDTLADGSTVTSIHPAPLAQGWSVLTITTSNPILPTMSVGSDRTISVLLPVGS